MRKLILSILLILCLTIPASGGNVVTFFAPAGGGGCNLGTDSIGSDTSFSPDYMYLVEYTASCSGNLGTFYAYSYYNYGAVAAVCVYLDDGDDTPDAGDSLVGCTASPLDDAATSWISGAADGGSVTQNSHYWIALIADNDNWACGADGARYYRACANCTSSPPSDLTGTWSSSSSGTWSIYVTVE